MQLFFFTFSRNLLRREINSVTKWSFFPDIWRFWLRHLPNFSKKYSLKFVLRTHVLTTQQVIFARSAEKQKNLEFPIMFFPLMFFWILSKQFWQHQLKIIPYVFVLDSQFCAILSIQVTSRCSLLTNQLYFIVCCFFAINGIRTMKVGVRTMLTPDFSKRPSGFYQHLRWTPDFVPQTVFFSVFMKKFCAVFLQFVFWKLWGQWVDTQFSAEKFI